MQVKKRHESRTTSEHAEPAAAPAASPPPASSTNVMVNYGTHRLSFPIRGMQVGAAREVLTQLLNLDDSAVAVINGRPVENSTVIESDVTLLSFVKPSSIRG